MRVLGADENGLGPQLGPLVCTAATIEVERYDPDGLAAAGERWGVADSKRSSAFGRMAHAEGVALAVAARQAGGAIGTMEELLGALGLEAPDVLRGICPGGEAQRACWGPPLALPAFGGSAEAGERVLAGFESEGARVVGVKTLPYCAKALNTARTDGLNKLALDLHGFERLILDAATPGEELLAVCGLVGGIRRYGPRFAHLRGARVITETKGLAAYRVPDVGEVRFELSADARHAPVALASMVGKVVRELFMARLNRHYLGIDPNLRAASGYYDPVTRAFVQDTAELRARTGVPDECFLREG